MTFFNEIQVRRWCKFNQTHCCFFSFTNIKCYCIACFLSSASSSCIIVIKELKMTVFDTCSGIYSIQEFLFFVAIID